MKMKKIILILTISILNISCSSDLITIVDEYNQPYDIKVIPGDNNITVNFWSGVLATDFTGFNFYVNDSGVFIQTNDAIIGTNGLLPTYPQSNHIRTNFNITIPRNFQNNLLYYVSVTAYGTNDLVENKYIETKISGSYKVIPRPEGELPAINIGENIIVPSVGNVAFITATNTIVSSGGFRIQNFGVQSDFNSIVIVTNMDYNKDFDNTPEPLLQGSLYILYNGTGFVKLRVTSVSTTSAVFRWAYQSNASLWNGV